MRMSRRPGIMIADQPLPVSGRRLDIHHVAAADGGQPGARSAFMRKQARAQLAAQVEPYVREPEIIAQAADRR